MNSAHNPGQRRGVKLPTEYLAFGKPHLLLSILPKAVLADVAWNFALRIDGEDREEGALNILLGEAELVRPDGRWRRKLEALERSIAARTEGRNL